MASEKASFHDFKLNKQLLNAVEELGYDEPTPIQQKAIPLVLNGHDVMGIAQTGTGKTAAFVLPILYKAKYAQGNDPRVLILAPTRELALQIEQSVKELSMYTDLRYVAVYGGVGPKVQIEAVQQGVDILIATPGRFMDIYLKGELVTKSIKTLVLDEADKMMDMGFMPQIRKILEVIPVKRQNLLFSATMPEKVVTLSEEFLEFPEVAEVAPQATVAETVNQELYEVPNLKSKINLLEYFLKKEEFSRVLIFTKTKTTADNVFKYLERKDYGSIRVIHSNKGQNSRINAINQFKEGELRILVSTDVSARGIDVTEVSHVINFDVPIIYEDYVHRIGRTGRALKKGKAITFANQAEMFHIGKIEKMINDTIQVNPIPEEVTITETPKQERQDIEREIDMFKRRENPDFKGAFHEKKVKFKDKKHTSKKRRRR
ncbi:DEAD/DEAH box helicase [Fulvivirga sediminis]|uniref:DEAD/DEAH box helicase n=1 Tax=Fulvivirga sediminis TaxID=2803949 RepID=A0A937F8M8_9BACT|nr:DEAD/DEAH box helicase [Fulvivirga sediminis]MBL3657037.1 DEAD/DEAH box helicase [Fulvivirga sediminis]